MDFTKFKGLLNEQVEWPHEYTFKFVIHTQKKTDLISLIEDHSIQEKLSRNGKYTSITSRKLMHNADEVVAVYQEVSKIEGILSL